MFGYYGIDGRWAEIHVRRTVYPEWVYCTGKPMMVAGVRAAWQNAAMGGCLDAPEVLPAGTWGQESTFTYPVFVERG